jgi:hypothetical protein
MYRLIYVQDNIPLLKKKTYLMVEDPFKLFQTKLEWCLNQG